MDKTKQYKERQKAKQLHDQIACFIGNCTASPPQQQWGCKQGEVKPLVLINVIFMLSM